MRKHLSFLLPIAAILLPACSDGYSREMLNAEYVTNTDRLLNAEGENFRFKVASTHSYVMTSSPDGAILFRNNGVVQYTQEGIAIVDLEHEAQVNPNNSAEDRTVYVYARQRHNPEIAASLYFVQPGQLKITYVSNPGMILSADGETIKLSVSSTQPYVMTSVPADACTFANDGIVDFEKQGTGFNDQEHEVKLNRNDDGQEREVRIYVKHRDNQQISTSVTLRQHGQATGK